MLKKTFTSIFLLSLAIIVAAQDLSLFQKKWMVQGGDTLPYRLLLPENYDHTKKYPVIFFLHGAGERGNDNEKQLVHGAKVFLRDSIREKFPAIVIFPQCNTNSYWSNVLRVYDDKSRIFHFVKDEKPTRYMQLLNQLVKYVMETYPVNEKQVYAGGLSMGGMGTFELVYRNPGLFAAAFPICGGANMGTAKYMKNVSWWIFHGAKDDVVPPSHSEKMVESLKKAKAKVKFTLYPEANHNSWDPAFAEPKLFDWLFMQVKASN